jgi:hypothetical protein
MPIETKTGETDAEKRLIAAMLKVDEAIHFYHSVHGNVSRESRLSRSNEMEDIIKKVARDTLYCSFCGKTNHETQRLIAGPSVFICDECIFLCLSILIKEMDKKIVAKEIKSIIDFIRQDDISIENKPDTGIDNEIVD